MFNMSCGRTSTSPERCKDLTGRLRPHSRAPVPSRHAPAAFPGRSGRRFTWRAWLYVAPFSSVLTPPSLGLACEQRAARTEAMGDSGRHSVWPSWHLQKRAIHRWKEQGEPGQAHGDLHPRTARHGIQITSRGPPCTRFVVCSRDPCRHAAPITACRALQLTAELAGRKLHDDESDRAKRYPNSLVLIGAQVRASEQRTLRKF